MKENKLTVLYLNKLLDHLKYHNKMAPFPVYDTDYVKDVENRLNSVKMSKEDYDELPVEACKYCKSLHIVSDEVDNNICMRCGSVNELIEFKNVYDYQKYLNKEEE